MNFAKGSWLFINNYFVFVCVVAIFFSSPHAGAEEKLPPRVLLLNSYHPQYDWTRELTNGVASVLSEHIPVENLHVEYMDSRRYSGDLEHRKVLLKLFQHTSKKFTPDVIITADDDAFNFMLNHGESLHPGVPIVFSGVNLLDRKKLEHHRNVTGIEEGESIYENLSLIHQLQPDVQRIFLLADKKMVGKNLALKAKNIIPAWLRNNNRSTSIEVLTDFSIQAFTETSRSFDKQTAILVLAVHEDNVGEYFSYRYHLPKLTAASGAPVYGMWGGGIILGQGAVGGFLNDPFENGVNTARLAMKILNGDSAQNIPVMEKAVYRPYIDHDQLKRFGLSSSDLPLEAIVTNQPYSFYRSYNLLTNIVISLFAILLLVIIWQAYKIRMRQLRQAELNTFNVELEKMVQVRTAELQRQKVEIERLANHDELTGLPTARLSNDRLQMAVRQAERNKQQFAVLYLDLDSFKEVNDTYGHDAGDGLLKNVAEKIEQTIRLGDTAGRIGGDEFLIILHNIESIDMINNCCERLIAAISAPFEYKGKSLLVGVSIGVSIYPSTANDADNLKNLADQAMYKIKRQGKNNYYVEVAQS